MVKWVCAVRASSCLDDFFMALADYDSAAVVVRCMCDDPASEHVKELPLYGEFEPCGDMVRRIYLVRQSTMLDDFFAAHANLDSAMTMVRVMQGDGCDTNPFIREVPIFESFGGA